MQASDRLKKASISIMRHPVFCAFSGVVAYCKVEVTESVPTAATNVQWIKYNPKFVDSLTDPELRFVVLHEAMHVSYRHLHVWKQLWDKNPKLTNIAADTYVNLGLADTDKGEGFIVCPKIGIQPDPQYRGLSVKQIYDRLLQEQEDDPQQDQGGGQGEGFDSHDFEGAAQQSAEEVAAAAEEIQRALRQGDAVARARGKGKGRSSLMADVLAPKVNWRDQLRDFVRETCSGRDESSWAKPNRRFVGDDIYMPSMHSEKMGELVVILDTSGSCFSGTVISAFASELAAIVDQVKPDKVRTLYVDDHVHGEQVFEDGQFAVTQLKVQGGGGTDLRLGFDYISEKRYTPQAVIVFSDGYTPYPTSTPCPTLWVMTTDIQAPIGTSIRIEV